MGDEAIEEALASASGHDWITDDGSRVRITQFGIELFQRAAQVQDDLQVERMQGISAEEFATTIEVLQRMIVNVGGDAWHW